MGTSDDVEPVAPGPRRSRLAGLEQRLLHRLRGRSFGSGAILVVGFSGGPDSLALAAALARLGKLADIRPILAHVDHRLRLQSAAEGERAAALAAELGLPVRVLRRAGDPRDGDPGLGLEEAARRARYALLAALCQETAAACLVLAHHRNDQAETVLLHLLRGAGLAGARGMAEWSERPVPWWPDPATSVPRRPDPDPATLLSNPSTARCHPDPSTLRALQGPSWLQPGALAPGSAAQPPRSTRDRAVDGPLRLWRPFLTEPRQVLRAYVATRGLAPIFDPSNDDPGLRRNALRRTVLPAIEATSPGATAALARFGWLAAADDEALAGWAARVRLEATEGDGALRLTPLRAEPVAVVRRVIRGWLAEVSGDAVKATAERVEAILDRVRTGAGGRLDVGGGAIVVCRGGRLRLEPERGEGAGAG